MHGKGEGGPEVAPQAGGPPYFLEMSSVMLLGRTDGLFNQKLLPCPPAGFQGVIDFLLAEEVSAESIFRGADNILLQIPRSP